MTTKKKTTKKIDPTRLRILDSVANVLGLPAYREDTIDLAIQLVGTEIEQLLKLEELVTRIIHDTTQYQQQLLAAEQEKEEEE